MIAATHLAAMAARMALLNDSNRYLNKFLCIGEPDRVSLAGFARRFEEDLTVREWVTHLFERYAIGQHFLTGARKWLTGIDGFFFYPTGEGYRLREEGYRWDPYPGVTKIWASIQMLRDLGLVKKNGDLDTTETGRRIGKQCLKSI